MIAPVLSVTVPPRVAVVVCAPAVKAMPSSIPAGTTIEEILEPTLAAAGVKGESFFIIWLSKSSFVFKIRGGPRREVYAIAKPAAKTL